MNDGEMYVKALNHYEQGDFKPCYILLKIVADKYKDVKLTLTNANFIVQVYCAYQVICATMGRDNIYVHKLLIQHKTLTPDLVKHAKKTYCMALLYKQEYQKIKPYMPYLQEFTGPNITPETISYFQQKDKNKTLLIYNSGGIGDIIMYSRFLRKVCASQPENKIIFLVNDNLHWLFHAALQISNLQLIALNTFKIFPRKYDYHTNITMLFIHLHLTYDMLYIDYYLETIQGNTLLLDSYRDSQKKNIIINWSGNKSNIMERYNRSIALENLIPVFISNNHDVQWLSIQKNLTIAEEELLQKYNVKNLGPLLDNTGDAFKDSVTLLQAVDLVITTDTSLVHLAGTMNIPCWCLLTIGCDWRWTYTDNRWYPKVKTFKQNAIADWTNVIEDLICALNVI